MKPCKQISRFSLLFFFTIICLLPSCEKAEKKFEVAEPLAIEDIARISFDSLKSNDIELFKKIIMQKPALKKYLAKMRQCTPDKYKKAMKADEDQHIDKIHDSYEKSATLSFNKIRKKIGTKAWANARFTGINKKQARTSCTLLQQDVYYIVIANKKMYQLTLKSVLNIGGAMVIAKGMSITK